MSSESVLVESLAASTKNSIVGGPFGSNLVSRDYVPSGVPVIRGQNMGSKWVGGEFVFVSEEKASSLESNKARPGDLVFTQRGTLGQVAIVPCAPYSEYIISQSQMKLTPDPAKADVSYLYYAFLSPEQQDYIRNTAIQTGVPHTNLGILKKTPITLPSLRIQREIAAVLNTLDDRITLLRETNATLESIAQALFKSWFVDFDPVRAKQEGRAPEGMDETTAALFPDGFEESELGLAPRGWKLLPLSMAFDINPTRKLKKGELAQYLDMASVGIKGHTVDLTVEREMGSGSKFCNGDTLLARITPCLENGKTAFVDFMSEEAIGWGSTEFVVLRPRPPLPEYFGYLLCRHAAFRDHAIQSMSGTSGRQRIQNDMLGRYPVAIPPDGIAKAFGEVVSALQKRIASNHETSLTLSSLRDTLLPRLISGQLRLPEAEALAA